MANDPEALDRLFAKMQEPETLAKLQGWRQPELIAAAILRAILGNSLTPPLRLQSEEFQQKVQALSQDPNFTAAAGDYVGGMKAARGGDQSPGGRDGGGFDGRRHDARRRR